MQSIQDLTGNGLPLQPTTSADRGEKTAQDQRVIDRLFERLVAEFDHKFASKIPNEQAEDDLKAIWSERLEGLSVDEIRAGIDKLPQYIRRSNGWPPGATEFRELCRPHREPYHRLVDMAPYKQLEQQKASPDFALEQIRKLRNQMAKS